jgi:hypothetical protein
LRWILFELVPPAFIRAESNTLGHDGCSKRPLVWEMSSARCEGGVGGTHTGGPEEQPPSLVRSNDLRRSPIRGGMVDRRLPRATAARCRPRVPCTAFAVKNRAKSSSASVRMPVLITGSVGQASITKVKVLSLKSRDLQMSENRRYTWSPLTIASVAARESPRRRLAHLAWLVSIPWPWQRHVLSIQSVPADTA